MATGMTAEELADLEASVGDALDRRDETKLNVLGYGEISVALGYPVHRPLHACKRTPPLDNVQFEQYRQLVRRYVSELRAAGLAVAETDVHAVPRGDELIAYLVQPMLPPETLGHRVLQWAEPDPDHPFLVALGEALRIVTPSLSIDAQVTNWSWNGSRLTLLDVGTPFLWDDDGALLLDMTPFLAMIPAVTRPLIRRDLTRLTSRWREPRGVALDVVANLYREGLDHWVDPTIVALNEALGDEGGIAVEEAEAIYEEDLRTFPRLTRLKQLERIWKTRIRRRPYDFFVKTTFDG